MPNLERIDEEIVTAFVYDLLDYYQKFDDNSINVVHGSDENIPRNNAGWYHYKDEMHYIHINVPNILNLKNAVDAGLLTTRDFYSFVSLIVGHEFRHFLQARFAMDGIPIEGYTKKDILLNELIIYIKMFFDRYYQLNKGFIKCEEDAEKFAVKNSLEFLSNYYPELEPEVSIVRAVNFYARLHTRAGMISTVPGGSKSVDEILTRIEEHIKKNLRIPDLSKTLTVADPRHYEVHDYFGLNREAMMTPEFLRKYRSIFNGSKQDLLVVRRILNAINNPLESLESFPEMRKRFIRGNL